ncbi:hypothetical protein [Bradyrhizobium sp. UFLA05-112]
MADELEALKAKRTAMMKEIMGTFKRSSNPHPKQQRASLTRQIGLLEGKIRDAPGM